MKGFFDYTPKTPEAAANLEEFRAKLKAFISNADIDDILKSHLEALEEFCASGTTVIPATITGFTLDLAYNSHDFIKVVHINNDGKDSIRLRQAGADCMIEHGLPLIAIYISAGQHIEFNVDISNPMTEQIKAFRKDLLDKNPTIAEELPQVISMVVLTLDGRAAQIIVPIANFATRGEDDNIELAASKEYKYTLLVDSDQNETDTILDTSYLQDFYDGAVTMFAFLRKSNKARFN